MNRSGFGLLVLSLLIPSVLLGGDEARYPQFKRLNDQVPTFNGMYKWMNTPEVKLKNLRGDVVLLHFWNSCSESTLTNLPHYDSWNKTYAKNGFKMVGVHTPERGQKVPDPNDKMEVDQVFEDIRTVMKRTRMQLATGIDLEGTVGERWQVASAPTLFLIDRKGRLRYRWEGVLNWKSLQGEPFFREKIKELLAERAE